MRASLLFNNQWDVYIVDAGSSKEEPDPQLCMPHTKQEPHVPVLVV